ncbi:MAG: hypothetical protein HZA15_14670 [Nitrospirae bacterium]|nr:hypothetical protein [Nitrospirota bacterium]
MALKNLPNADDDTPLLRQLPLPPAPVHRSTRQVTHFSISTALPLASVLYTATGHANHVSGVATSPNRDIFVSGSWDKTIRLWQASDGKLLRKIDVRQYLLFQ